MANRYWIAQTAQNWNTSAAWSDTQFGASGASVPSNGDDVFFATSGLIGSGMCTINVNPTIRNMTISGGSLNFNGSTCSLSGNYIQTSGIIDHSNSTIRFIGSGLKTCLMYNDNHFNNIIVSGGYTEFAVSYSGFPFNEGNLTYIVNETSYPSTGNFPLVDYSSHKLGLGLLGNVITKRGVGPRKIWFSGNHSGNFIDLTESYQSALVFSTNSNETITFPTSGSLVCYSLDFITEIGATNATFVANNFTFSLSGVNNSLIESDANIFTIGNYGSGSFNNTNTTFNFYTKPKIQIQRGTSFVNTQSLNVMPQVSGAEVLSLLSNISANIYGDSSLAGQFNNVRVYSGDVCFVDSDGLGIGSFSANSIILESGSNIMSPTSTNAFGEQFDYLFVDEFGDSIAVPIVVTDDFNILGADAYAGTAHSSNFYPNITVGDDLLWRGQSTAARLNAAYSSPWNITVSGTATFRNAAIGYGNFLGVGTADATGCLDLCNNTGFNFGTSSARYLSTHTRKVKECRPITNKGRLLQGGTGSINFNNSNTTNPRNDSIHIKSTIMSVVSSGVNYITGDLISPSGVRSNFAVNGIVTPPSRTSPGKYTFNAGTANITRSNYEQKNT